jgi:hypothetical protein
VYRERLGTWFLKSQKHEGVAWRSMAAKPTTKFFSLVYASSVRPEKDIQTKYILSEKPCQEGNLQDRVCVESLKNTKLPFEILNPWVGGDFNPFEGKRGLDLCLIENSNFLDYFLQQYKKMFAWEILFKIHQNPICESFQYPTTNASPECIPKFMS